MPDTVFAPPRHTALVRMTHWIHTIAFFGLIVSGIAILVAHPRFYWGNSGGDGSAALIELPLSVNLDQSGWGRSLHFLSAWVFVLNGAIYVLSGMRSRHFRHMSSIYEVPQRMAYRCVIFLLSPLAIVTGLAMSPAVTSVVPFIESMWGGHQSSRTIHFGVALLLVLFLFLHVTMVVRNGFRKLMRGMIKGRMA